MEVGYEKNKEINTGVDLSFYGLLWGTMFYLQPVGGRTGQGGHIFLDASRKKIDRISRTPCGTSEIWLYL